MKIVALSEGCAKRLITREMREHTKLNLRVIRREQDVLGRGDECPANLPAHLAPDWNILKIRCGGCQPAGGGLGLLVTRVNAACLRVDQGQERFSEAVLEFGHFAVLEQSANDWMGLDELLQLGSIGRVPGLDPLGFGKAQLLEKDALKLGLGIDVKLLA